MSARHDPVARRFVPNPILVNMAHNALLELEDHEPGRAFVRQQWEAAYGAIRVAIDALREIWPLERHNLTVEDQEHVRRALDDLVEAYIDLDEMAEGLVGWVMVAVLHGTIKTEEELNDALTGNPTTDGDANDET